MTTTVSLPHIALLFTGLCALIQCALTALVILRRAKTGILLLDGGDTELASRIRAHGNFVETVPITLLILALLEMRSANPLWLYTLGTLLVLGRIVHAYALLQTNANTRSRLAGMILTLTAISFGGVGCLLTFAS
jgi:uncharacterized protein